MDVLRMIVSGQELLDDHHEGETRQKAERDLVCWHFMVRGLRDSSFYTSVIMLTTKDDTVAQPTHSGMMIPSAAPSKSPVPTVERKSRRFP